MRTNWSPEQAEIVIQKGKDNGVSDPRVLFAIMIAEGGQPGMEFNYGIEHDNGKVTVPAKYAGFERQAGNAAFTVKKAEGLYKQETGNEPADSESLYTPEFIKYLSHGGGETSLWPGYAPTSDPRDVQGKNFNHAKNVLLAYADVTGDKAWRQDPSGLKQEPNAVGKTDYDEYGKSRMREAKYGEIAVVAGQERADDVGDMHNRVLNLDRASGKSTSTSPMDYIIAPLEAVAEGLHYASSHFKGLVAGKGWKEADIQEVTGLTNEPFTPELRERLKHGGFAIPWIMGSEMPRRSLNMAADLVVDPFNAALGASSAIRGGSRLLRGMKDLFKSEEVTAMPQVTTGAAPVAPGAPSPGGAPSASPVATRPSATQEPGAIGTRAQEGDVIAPPSTEVPADIKSIIGKESMTPEESAKVREFNQSQKAKDSLAETQGKIAAKQAPVRDPNTGRMMKAKIQEESAAANAKAPYIAPPSPQWGRPDAQLVLKGFGKRGKADAITESSTPAQVEEVTKTIDPKQLSLKFREVADMETIFKDARKYIDEATLTDEQTRSVARHLLDSHEVNPFSIVHESAKKTGVPEQARVAAAAAIEKSAVVRLSDTVHRFNKNPNDELKESILTQMASVVGIVRAIRATEAERAAALRMAKTGQSPEVKVFEQLMENSPDGISIERFAQAMDMMETQADKLALMKNAGGIGPVKGTMLQIMMNGLVSSTATPLWNYAAGASLFGAKVMETWRMSRFADSGVAPGTAGVMAWSFLKSYLDLTIASAKINGKLMAKTEAQAGATARLSKEMEGPRAIFTDPTETASAAKLGSRRAISAKNYGMEDSWFSPAIDYAGHAINVPTFMVGSSDAFLRFATTQAFMEARAFSEASMDVMAQLRAGKEMNKAQAAAAVAERRAKLMSDPDQQVLIEGQFKSLKDIGSDNSDLLSMMSKLKSGTLGSKIDDATRNSLMGRVVYPFFRVGYLSGREAIIRTPILARFAPSVAADLAAGGERAAKAHAQMSTGYALGATVGVFVAGGEMTGDGPPDPAGNALWRTTHVPNSLHIPGTDTNIPYTRLGPLGQVMRAMANAAYMLPRVADSEEVAANLATTIAMIGTSIVSDVNLNKDFADLTASLAGRDTTGLARWAERKATMPAPYSALLKQLNRQIQGELQLGDGIFERAAMLIPGYKGTTYYDLWGRATEVPNDTAWDGLRNNTGFAHKTSDPQINKLVDKLDRDRVTFTGPSRNHDGAVMTLPEYMELRRLFGQEVKGPNDKNLVGELEELMASDEYIMASSGPRGSRQTLVSKLVEGFKKAALGMLLEQELPDGQLKHQSFMDDWMKRKADKVMQDESQLQVGK